LIVIDPIGSFLGGDTDSDKDNKVRAVLAPLARLAERYGVAVLIVAHRRKSPGANADEMALGSRAFTGIARAVWHLSRDPENKERRLFVPGKNNLSRGGDGLAFTIGGDPAALHWETGTFELSADDALAAENAHAADGDGKPGPDPVKRNGAAQWLRGMLAEGPVEVKRLEEEAKAAGLAWRTVQRAASDEVGVERIPPEQGQGWRWSLSDCPPSAPPNPPSGNNLASWRDAVNADVSATAARPPAKLFNLGECIPNLAHDPSMRTPGRPIGSSDHAPLPTDDRDIADKSDDGVD
jgi:putative DNA primase/helicase